MEVVNTNSMRSRKITVLILQKDATDLFRRVSMKNPCRESIIVFGNQKKVWFASIELGLLFIVLIMYLKVKFEKNYQNNTRFIFSFSKWL